MTESTTLDAAGDVAGQAVDALKRKAGTIVIQGEMAEFRNSRRFD